MDNPDGQIVTTEQYRASLDFIQKFRKIYRKPDEQVITSYTPESIRQIRNLFRNP